MSISRKKLQRIIQEEIGLVLISPLPIEVEPRDVTDAFHPAEIVPREDAWAGGDNLEDDLDHAYFETMESNSGPHSSVSWSHNPDSLTPGEAAGVGYAACEADLGINEESNMNIKTMILCPSLLSQSRKVKWSLCHPRKLLARGTHLGKKRENSLTIQETCPTCPQKKLWEWDIKPE
jgi:hypothetical protein